MIAKTLIVEDRPHVGEDNERYLHAITKETRDAHGITGFQCIQAKSGSAALAALEKAKKEPFHTVLLDLHLPQNEGDRAESLEVGFQVMDVARRTGAGKCIIAVSAYAQPEVMARAIRGGVVNFVPKPYSPEQLREGFLEAWRHLLRSEKDRLEQERIRRLLPHAQRCWVKPLGGVFFELLRTTADATGELKSELHERMALDFERGAGDPIVREVARIETAIQTSNSKWLELTGKPEADDKPPRACLETKLKEAIEELAPILAQAKVSDPPDTVTDVDAFGDDLEVILRELLSGPLLSEWTREELPRIEVAIRREAPWAWLTVQDNGSTMPDDEVEKINRGQQIPPGSEFGRTWGLSILRNTAIRGAGKIQVTAHETGNGVTYQLPLA